MTDAEIEAILNQRMRCLRTPMNPCDYLTSKDALSWVIREMIEEERVWLSLLIARAAGRSNGDIGNITFALTCDPRVIAECVAKAIKGGKA